MGHSRTGSSERTSAAVLVGRDGALREARTALAEGPGVVVCAAPGCGSSAVAAAVAAEPALRIVATPAGRSLPGWALRSALAEGEAAGDALALAARVADRLGASGPARARPPIVLVEGVDDLDDESAAVLLELVASGRARLVATRHRTRPAPPTVAALWRDAGVRRLDLEPLDDDAASELVRGLLDGDVDGRTTSEIVHLGAGAPAALIGLVAASREAGSLRRDGGLWRLVAAPTIPPDLAERAEAELDGTSDAERRALELLAIAGPLPVLLADAACGPDALEALERRALIEVDDAGAVRHTSPLLAGHLDATLRPLARRRLVEALADAADAVGATDRDDEVGLRAIVWHLDAGRPLPAERLLEAAHLAIDHLDAALGERLAGASAAAHPTAAAVLLQAWCADQLGATDRGRAIIAAHAPEDDEADVALAIRRAEQAFWHEREGTAARRLLDETAQRLPAPWDLAAVAQLHVFDVLEGRIPDALAAVELAEHPEPLVGSTAALAAALAQVIDDRPGDGLATAQAALDRLSGPTPTLYIDPGVHIIALGLALHGLGDLRAADELTSTVYRHAIGRPGLQAQGWSALLHSMVLTALGRPSDAVAVALEAEHIWAGAQAGGLAAWSAASAALAAAERADLETVTVALERIDRYTTAPFTLFDPWVDRARAWQHELDGRHDAAIATLVAAGADAQGAGRPSLAAAVAHDLVRLGAAEAAVDLLDGLDRSSPLTLLRLRLARAAACADAPALAVVADELRAGGADGWAAEAAALSALAAPARAPAVRPAVAALAARTGLATPPIVRLLETEEQQGLTRREEQIVALAAEGLSNRAIADTLVVSVRTVENHLHRAFAKLGIASRAELLARSTG